MKLLDVSTAKYPNTFAQIDDETFDELNKNKWSACERNGKFYVERGSAGGKVNFKYYLHRVITKAKKGEVVDHADGDGLNNQSQNLRLCTQSENTMNAKIRSNNKSGFKGVSWDKSKNKWESCIKVNGKKKSLGRFIDKIQAAIAYNEASKRYFGVFAKPNNMEGLI